MMQNKKTIIFLMLACLVFVMGCKEKTVSTQESVSEETNVSVVSTASQELISDIEISSEEVPVTEDGHTISFSSDDVMTMPGKVHVTYNGQTIEARENIVSWAYAVDDVDWSSVNEKFNEAIDGSYAAFLVTGEEKQSLEITVEGVTAPEAIINIKRFPLENWIEDPDSEDAKGLRNRLEHLDEYNQYEEFENLMNSDYQYTLYSEIGENMGYIIELKVVWDTELYRGSSTVSFMVKYQLEE